MMLLSVHLVLPVFVVFTTASATRSFASSACGNQPIDLVFLIDSSSSIWKPDFDRMMQFIKDVSDQFEIGLRPTQTRIAVATFAESCYLQFHLWQNNRKDLLARGLKRIKHRFGHKTNTYAALNYMRKYMFSHRYGSRKNATHVAVVVTDGRSQNRQKTIEAAAMAKDDGILIFAIGVGNGVEYRELESVASLPSEDFIFEAEDFKSLDSMKYVLGNRTCGAHEALKATAQPPPTGTVVYYEQYAPPEIKRTLSPPAVQADIDPRLNVTNCGGKPADIYFALDASNSIWPEDFKKQLSFVRDLINMFDISPKKTRVGLATFSDRVKTIFDFNTRQDKNHLSKLVSNTTFMSGRTKTSEALRFIRQIGFSRDVARREVAHIMLIFTDGLSKRPRKTAREAELAKRDGIYVFSIGIGMSVEKTELQDIASDPDDDFVFHVSNFSVLNTIKDILAIKTCAIQPHDFHSDGPNLNCRINRPTDMMFVYDSAQLGIHRTRKITKFVYDITSALNTDTRILKVGRLMENCLTGADTYLTSQKHALDFDGIYFPDLRQLIRRLASHGFSQRYGGRRYARKVAVFFLDEEMENLKQASDEIVRLRNTKIFVVAVGNADLNIAAKFASKPTKEYLVHVPSYKYLQTSKTTLLQKLCKVFDS